MKIKYIPGTQMYISDLLSPQPDSDDTHRTGPIHNPHSIRQEQIKETSARNRKRRAATEARRNYQKPLA